MSPETPVVITAGYVLKRLDDHQRECSSRWKTLIVTVVCGFGSLTLTLIALVITILERGR